MKPMILPALFAVLLGISIGDSNVVLSEEVCFNNNDDEYQCIQPPPVLPDRPHFCCQCYIGNLTENLQSVNDTCSANKLIPCSTECEFECKDGYFLTSNMTVTCNEGQLTPALPTCNETNECLSDPCMYGGTCSDFINFYNCSCVPGYEGVNCENETNECLSDPCMNGGTCSDFINFYNCSCVPGYEGVNCENVTSTTEPMISTQITDASPSRTRQTTTLTRDQSTTTEQISRITSSGPETEQTRTAKQSSTSTPQGTQSGQTMTSEHGSTRITSNLPTEEVVTEGQPATSPRLRTTQSEIGNTCLVSVDTNARTTCVRNVLNGTCCPFHCSRINNSFHFCCKTGEWVPQLPQCGTCRIDSVTNLTNTLRRRRDAIPSDNPAVITIENTFESAVNSIQTVYLANVTTFSAQNLSNGNIEGTYVNDIMYSSEVSFQTIIQQVEANIRAIIGVVSVEVTDVQDICSPTTCKNDGVCQVDIDRLDFICECQKDYSGDQCEIFQDSAFFVAILVPACILLLFLIFVTILVVMYVRMNRHRIKKKESDSQELVTWQQSARQRTIITKDTGYLEMQKRKELNIHFSKEINARMQERSQEYGPGRHIHPMHHGHETLYNTNTDESSAPERYVEHSVSRKVTTVGHGGVGGSSRKQQRNYTTDGVVYNTYTHDLPTDEFSYPLRRNHQWSVVFNDGARSNSKYLEDLPDLPEEDVLDTLTNPPAKIYMRGRPIKAIMDSEGLQNHKNSRAPSLHLPHMSQDLEETQF